MAHIAAGAKIIAPRSKENEEALPLASLLLLLPTSNPPISAVQLSGMVPTIHKIGTIYIIFSCATGHYIEVPM